MKKIYIICIGLLLAGQMLQGQESKSGKTQFMVRGYGHTGLDYLKTDAETSTSFNGSAFSPIFLFKQGDKFMFETELEFELENNQLNIGLEYANLMYVVNKYVMIRAGKFLLPFGTFMERLHPAWINRLSTKPLGFGHDGIAPASGIGIELRGSAPIGGSTINYAFYSTNGPGLKDGSIEPDEAGMLTFENYNDNNNNKALGGRIGFLPFSNSSLEVGASYFGGKPGDKNSQYKDVDATLWAFDLSYVKQLNAMKGVVDIKAQYSQSQVTDANYPFAEEKNSLDTLYTYNNFSKASYSQLSFRPSMLSNKILKNIEVVGRYSQLNTPEGALWESNVNETSLGLNYWITWRQVIKINYGFISSEGGHEAVEGAGRKKSNALYIHWAMGF